MRLALVSLHSGGVCCEKVNLTNAAIRAERLNERRKRDVYIYFPGNNGRGKLDKVSKYGLLDIHAGAFETAVLNYFYPQLVDLETAETLKSSSLDQAKLEKWLQGGEETKSTVPLGYAGNPAGYKEVSRHVDEMICLQVEDIAKKMDGFISKKRFSKNQ